MAFILDPEDAVLRVCRGGGRLPEQMLRGVGILHLWRDLARLRPPAQGRAGSEEDVFPFAKDKIDLRRHVRDQLTIRVIHADHDRVECRAPG